MSGKDRTVIAVALLCMVLALTCSGMLMPGINAQRIDLQLVANEDIAKNMPPWLVILQTAAGSFRGIVVDVLWARAESKKQDGKFWESMQLCEWITAMQPRFPKVWANRAWDQAYNISVATHTPEERWAWVQKGVRLLRNEGIPLNPSAVLLYKELSWIHLHKIGMYSDDLHWYYKRALANEWEELLGPPAYASGKDSSKDGVKEVIEQFRPIAEMYQKYVNRQELSPEVAAEFNRLLALPDLKDPLTPLRPLALERFSAKLARVHDTLSSTDSLAAAKLTHLIELVEKQKLTITRDPLERIVEDDPAVKTALAELLKTGFKPDREMLKAIAALMAREPAPGEKAEVTAAATAALALELKADDATEESLGKLRAWLSSDSIAPGRTKLLALVRAIILDKTYNMNPLWMLELMDGRWLVPVEKAEKVPIPIDWRHPAAHGLYWASLGVRKLKGFVRAEDYDVLNTDRQVLHALQSLMQNGKLTYHYNPDPKLATYEAAPDPRYIDAYHYAMYGATDRISDDVKKNTTSIETFEAGHENFLIQATQFAYFYSNDPAQAQTYYKRLRDTYTQKQIKEGRPNRYLRPIEDFVVEEFINNEGTTDLDTATAIISGKIMEYIVFGLRDGDTEHAERSLDFAKRIHAGYQKKQDFTSSSVKGTDRNRMALPKFDTMVTNVMQSYLLGPGEHSVEVFILRSRAWRNAPPELQRRVFVNPDVENTLYRICQSFNLDPAQTFPEPPGLEQYRKIYGQPIPLQQGPQQPGQDNTIRSDVERK